MFNGVRENSFFYILEKGEKPTLKIGQVVSVSNPVSKYGQYPTANIFNQMDSVVDISVKVGDEIVEFKQLPSNLTIASVGQNVVVSEDKNAMNAEVEGMLCASQGIIDSVPYHESVVESCTAILRELNPQFAKEKAQEDKICLLEEKMGGIEDTLGSIQNLLTEVLNKGCSSKKKE